MEGLNRHHEMAARAKQNKSLLPSLEFSFEDYDQNSLSALPGTRESIRPIKASDRILLTAIASSFDTTVEVPETKVLKYLKPDFDVDAHNNSSSLPPIKHRYK